MGILKHLTISATGTLSAEPSQLKKWVEAHDGRWAPKAGTGTTHLIASKEAWKKRTPAVQAALDAGAWVVSYDWLEDSLQRKRKLAEKKYTWEFLRKQRKMRREMARLGAQFDAKKFNEGCEEVRRAMGSGTSDSIRKPKPKSKPKPSKSFFFGESTVTPFVSAAEDLKRRRAAREAAVVDGEDASARSASASSEERAVDSVSTSPRSQSSTPQSSSITKTPSPSAAAQRSPAAHTPAPSNVPPSAEQEAKKPSLKDLYHFYLDSTGFEYKVILVRTNYYTNSMTRYRLSILESHAKPHVYCTFVEYMPPVGGMAQQNAGGRGDAEMQRALVRFNKTAGSHGGATASQPRTPEQPASSPTEAARLQTLITPPAPCATAPYKALLVPQHSTFPTTWLAFRHAFRDMTLLSWEERFDESKTLQKARAHHFTVEPFVYAKPKPGLPVGLRTQDPALFQGQTLCRKREHVEVETSNDDGYVFNRFNLPGLMQPLSREGVIGSSVLREVEERKAREEVGVGNMAGGVVGARVKKVDWRYKPLFNGATGRPQNQGDRSMGIRR